MEDVIVRDRGEIGADEYILTDEFVCVFDETFLPGVVTLPESTKFLVLFFLLSVALVIGI